jgi:hypothetical protein
MSKNSSAASTAEGKNEMKFVPLRTGSEEAGKPAEVKNLPVEDLRNRAVVLALPNRKHDDLMEKRKRPEQFSTVHDRNSAVIKVVDAQGKEFTGNSPKSIKRLIEFRQDGFREAMDGNGKRMKAVFV